jgi:transposase InsO family protein
MISLIQLLGFALRNRFRSPGLIAAENLVLRHQLNILRRRYPRPIRRLHGTDRACFVWLLRRWPETAKAITIIGPDTVLRWHRMGFRVWWRWKSRNSGGRPRVDQNLRVLIRRMASENPLWGAPRIHGELMKLGFDVAQSTVSKYMPKRYGPPSQSWKTFLRNHADGIASIDFLIVPTIDFRLLYVFVILSHLRRQILWIAVTPHPTAEWTAQQMRNAFPWTSAPTYLVRDNDRKFSDQFKQRVQRLGIRDRPVAPRSPWQNGYVERVIGSIRRDLLDHAIVWSEAHLRRMLATYRDYYNTSRTHLGISKDCPSHRPIESLGAIISAPLLGGLHHRYARI